MEDFFRVIDFRLVNNITDILSTITGNAGWLDIVLANKRGTEESMTQSDVLRTLIAAQ